MDLLHIYTENGSNGQCSIVSLIANDVPLVAAKLTTWLGSALTDLQPHFHKTSHAVKV